MNKYWVHLWNSGVRHPILCILMEKCWTNHVCIWAKWPIRLAHISGLCSMKRISTPWRDARPLLGYPLPPSPSIKISQNPWYQFIYLLGTERHSESNKHVLPMQEQNTMLLAAARTRTAWYGVQCTYHDHGLLQIQLGQDNSFSITMHLSTLKNT